MGVSVCVAWGALPPSRRPDWQAARQAVAQLPWSVVTDDSGSWFCLDEDDPHGQLAELRRLLSGYVDLLEHAADADEPERHGLVVIDVQDWLVLASVGYDTEDFGEVMGALADLATAGILAAAGFSQWEDWTDASERVLVPGPGLDRGNWRPATRSDGDVEWLRWLIGKPDWDAMRHRAAEVNLTEELSRLAPGRFTVGGLFELLSVGTSLWALGSGDDFAGGGTAFTRLKGAGVFAAGGLR